VFPGMKLQLPYYHNKSVRSNLAPVLGLLPLPKRFLLLKLKLSTDYLANSEVRILRGPPSLQRLSAFYQPELDAPVIPSPELVFVFSSISIGMLSTEIFDILIFQL
ncbi:MAG: hypothetical protein ACXAB4_11765, partial [Candidatus Hodarchaeales archaeon]